LRTYPVLARVSPGYSEPKGTFPRVTHPSATPVLLRAFDLHVLSLPPAFVLSQDQTLKFEELCSSGVATGWSMRIDESQASFDNYVEAWLHKTHDFSVLICPCLHGPPGRRRLRFSFFHLQCQRARKPTGPPRRHSRQNTTGPSSSAPDVHFVRSWKRT
jgi:hypothetical protein